jgi:uncharacterized membrane protein YjfL (UPF0719 family)
LGLIYYLPPTSWLRFAAWLNIGFVIYICYGSTHSRLTGLHQAADKGIHAVRTGHAGAVLAWGGTAALFATRLADGLRQQAPLGEWFTANSWWMTVPLLVNVFLLCPIALRRLAAAVREGLEPQHGKKARAAVWMYGMLAAGTAGYLICLGIG